MRDLPSALASYGFLYEWGRVAMLEDEGRLEEAAALTADINRREAEYLDRLFPEPAEDADD